MSPTHEAPVPPIYSVQRFTTLVASVVVALASGTNYVFSAYGPQLASRLRISHTQLNIVALGGNIGVYSTGPIWGRIVDTRGPRIILACAFLFLLCGYLGMRHMFDQGLSEGETSISVFSFAILTLCCYLTGAGGNAGLASAVNSTAKSFPDQMRATTTGLVISGFGLSAFLFSSVARTFFAGNTSSFLLLLAAGTALPMVMGFFLVKYIPLPSHEPLHDREPNEVLEEEVTGSRSPLLHDQEEEAHLRSGYNSEEGSAEEDLEMSPQRAQVSLPTRRSTHNRSLSRGTALALDAPTNVYGVKLWKTLDFYLLSASLSLLSGTGLMYINNVGSMSQALYAFKNPDYDPIRAAKWQATQVSTISVMNCLGRILIGIVSDFTKNRYGLPRSYGLVLVAFVCFLSQVVASHIEVITDLWLASSVLGLGYGAVFSLFPTVCMEWFGMPHFSENWGYLSMSPIFAGNLFSLVFGYNLDRNEDKHTTTPSNSPAAHAIKVVRSIFLHRRAPGPPADVRCSRGLDCYVHSLYLTMGATLLALGITIWASLRDRKKVRMAMRRRGQVRRSAIIPG